MRILHTSDWHLGRGLHGESQLEAQAGFFDWLAETVRSERVDCLVVAGDVYDRALPPVDAVTLLDEALDRLLATGAQILLTAGNHDSAQRLGFGKRRSARAGLHVRTGSLDLAEPLLLNDRYGTVACYGIGYLEPAVVAADWGVKRSHQGVLAEALKRVRADLSTRSTGRCLVAAHAFVAGGEPSDSERDIRVGGVDRATASLFEGISYTAMGHLHRPQQVAESVRYSGSPIAFSFSEAGHTKGCLLVDLGAEGVESTQFLPTPVRVRLARLRGRLDDLLRDPDLGYAETAYCEVDLTDTERPRAPMERLRSRFPRTLSLRFDPQGVQPSLTAPSQRIGLSDEDLCCSFFDSVRGHGLSPDERLLVQQSLEASRLAEAAR